ncbi:MAG TPA: FliA/WhiG family RNA polymerase sigma factor [Planctomycetota bacterium]|nr:FliA/WhiG family RNA polymerase sigma factor [Planctomycetota bacterium]
MTRADAYVALRTPEQKRQRVLDSLLLVKYVVGRLAIDLPPSLDREDLASWGTMGLMRAVETYDATRGVAFSTHAYIQIRGAILDELRRQDVLPRTRRDRLRTVKEARAALEQKLGRPPAPEELAEATGLSADDLDEALLSEHTTNVLSLGDGHDDAGIGALLRSDESQDPSEIAGANEMRERLAQAITRLPEVERRVVTLYYAESLLLKEIGEVLGFSESRASQIHARALERLRACLRAADAAKAEV